MTAFTPLRKVCKTMKFRFSFLLFEFRYNLLFYRKNLNPTKNSSTKMFCCLKSPKHCLNKKLIFAVVSLKGNSVFDDQDHIKFCALNILKSLFILIKYLLSALRLVYLKG